MTGPYGVTETGFNIKTFTEVLESMENRFKTAYGNDIAVGEEFRGDTIAAQECEIYSKELYQLWEAFQDTWANSLPDMASGVSLSHTVSLVGAARQEATYSIATVTLTNDDTSSQLFSSGSLVKQSTTGQNWETIADVTVPALSTADVQVRPIIKGAILATPGSIDTVVTIVTGISTVTNTNAATIGFDESTDEELRLSKEKNIVVSSGGVIGAIIEAVSQIDGVTYTAGQNNDSHFPDVNGLDGNSFKITVGGQGYDSQEVAEAIGRTKPVGIKAVGSVVQSVTVDGVAMSIGYDTVDDVLVYLHVTVTTIPNDPENPDSYPTNGDTLIADALETFGEGLDNGETLYRWLATSSLNSIPGITSVDLRLNTTGNNATETADLTVNPDERLLINVANIVVVSS